MEDYGGGTFGLKAVDIMVLVYNEVFSFTLKEPGHLMQIEHNKIIKIRGRIKFDYPSQILS